MFNICKYKQKNNNTHDFYFLLLCLTYYLFLDYFTPFFTLLLTLFSDRVSFLSRLSTYLTCLLPLFLTGPVFLALEPRIYLFLGLSSLIVFLYILEIWRILIFSFTPSDSMIQLDLAFTLFNFFSSRFLFLILASRIFFGARAFMAINFSFSIATYSFVTGRCLKLCLFSSSTNQSGRSSWSSCAYLL